MAKTRLCKAGDEQLSQLCYSGEHCIHSGSVQTLHLHRAGAAQTQHPPTGSAEVAQCSRDVLQKVVVQTCEGAEAYSGQSLGLDCTYWSWGDILELTCYLWRWQGSRRNKHE